ncbi:MAG: serine/threonine-protein kinase [Polyangiaceae bacterium]
MPGTPLPTERELPRRVRDGRYSLLRVLGEGSQGTTYEAADHRDGSLVAMKCFVLRTASRWKDVELAERETRVLASLAHPSLPAYREHFEEDGALWLVMEKIDGEDLRAWKARGAPFTPDDAWALLATFADVFATLHGRSPPVVHRDVKPANVVRRPDGSFALVDFGSVRDRLRPEGGSTVVGTFGYMAPEQFQGRAMPATDLYGAGATVLALLTREEPENLPHSGLALDVERALGPRVPQSLRRLLAAMLSPNPDDRPRDLREAVATSRGTSRASPGKRDRRRGRDVRSERRASPDTFVFAELPTRRELKRFRRAVGMRFNPIPPILWIVWSLGWPFVRGAQSMAIMFVSLFVVFAVSKLMRGADEHRLLQAYRKARAEALGVRDATFVDEATSEAKGDATGPTHGGTRVRVDVSPFRVDSHDDGAVAKTPVVSRAPNRSR